MNILLKWLLRAIAILIVAYLLPGVHIAGFVTALVLAVVLGIINTILRPVLLFLTLPINILTLGLFTLVINAALVILASYIVPGFILDGFLWALAFAVVLSLVNGFFDMFDKKE